MLKALFFDLYNTLARFYPPREELQQKVCREFGLEVSPEGITRGYAQADAFMAQENARLPLRQRSLEEREAFWARYEQLVLQGAGVELSLDLAGRIFRRVRQLPYDLALFEDVLPNLEGFKRRGLILGLISNINQDPQKLCRRLGISPYLDFAMTSQEAGWEKPHPQIFLAALRKAGTRPEETVHVGDQYESDVVGARGVGIRPILLDRYRSFDGQADCPVVHTLWELQEYLRR